MADLLRQIEDAIGEVDATIRRLERKRIALQEAARVLRDIDDPDQTRDRIAVVEREAAGDPEDVVIWGDGVPTSSSKEFEGVKIEDAATTILREAGGDGMTADEVAKVAMQRGYRSTSFRNPENDPKKIITSFRVTLRRLRERFDYDENSRVYKLREST